MEDNLIKKLMTSIKCGCCGKHYEEDDIEIIEHSDELWFLKVCCSSCNVKCLVAAIIREEPKAEYITDLSEAELDSLKHVDAVRADDVLDMHNLLKDFHGDIPGLLQH